MEWLVVYEVQPMRGLFQEKVVAKTQEKAIDFLQTINNHNLRIIGIYDTRVLEIEGTTDV